MKKQLRHGFTTGACATAAAKGAALMLAHHEQVGEATLDLPVGITATFPLYGQTLSADSSACFVVKDAGDDPDVTNGAEVHARVTLLSAGLTTGADEIVITGGAGIGRVTKPGLAVAPGEWAINPVPKQMITDVVREVLPGQTVQVEISIPDGEIRAKRTLNARLGIVGGLSILGTTGIVRPLSAKAWTDTIDAALDVARACGCSTVILSTGRTSEMAAQRHLPDLPEEGYIMMGDHIAYALAACSQRGFDRPAIACQFAKLLKIACGHENTHAAASELDLATLHRWATEEGLPKRLLNMIVSANTAREIIIESGFDDTLLNLVCTHADLATHKHAPGLSVSFLVANYSGQIIYTTDSL